MFTGHVARQTNLLYVLRMIVKLAYSDELCLSSIITKYTLKKINNVESNYI